jgi:lipooligosaccharide transport system ATP-binding protein
MTPVRAERLTKKYGDFVAVNGIEFSVQAGECVGFLGPNGAGKTTTIKMLCCLTPVTEGSAEIFGMSVRTSPREIKAVLGICPQEDNLDPDFKVRKNLVVYARYFGLSGVAIEKRIDELLDLMQLKDKTRAKISELSGGMKRRLILVRALLHEPKLLVLDEPTTGLDPQVRQLIWQKIRQLKAQGLTVLLTTHYMEEAAQLCDRVILMDSAKILLEGTPADLIQREIGEEVIELWDFPDEVRSFVHDARWDRDQTDNRIYIYDRGNHRASQTIAEKFPHQQRLIRRATLEDVFLKRAGRSLRE